MSLRFIGLTTGMHGFHIHENGVRDNDCLTAGSHYNPQGVRKGSNSHTKRTINHFSFQNSHSGKSNILYRHLGDLGNVMADNKGEIHMEVVDSLIQLHGPSSTIGRSFVLHAKRDDLGLGGDEESKKTGNAGARIACGTILLH